MSGLRLSAGFGITAAFLSVLIIWLLSAKYLVTFGLSTSIGTLFLGLDPGSISFGVSDLKSAGLVEWICDFERYWGDDPFSEPTPPRLSDVLRGNLDFSSRLRTRNICVLPIWLLCAVGLPLLWAALLSHQKVAKQGE